MVPDTPPPLLSPRLARALGWSVLFAVLALASFTLPLMPGADLDPSWRMALGYFYENGMQFGHDVIFTYGPLGFVMGKTFSGLQFWSLIAGQVVLALVSAAVIIFQGRRLQGNARLVFFGFFLLFGITYEDALHMLVIAILAFELLRMADEKRTWLVIPIAAIFAGYAQIKFTDLLLATYGVLVAVGYHGWRGQWRSAGLLGLSYVGTFLGIWLACGQSLLNLPAYFYGSWQISAGYQWAMGFPTAPHHLWPGLVVLALMVAYAGLHLLLAPAKPRAWANVLLLGAFVYLNWKHGFVRSDGHMIGFFFCMLLPITAYPALLDDPPRWRLAHRWVFIFALGFSLWSLENALASVVQGSLSLFQSKTLGTLRSVFHWEETRQTYRDRLSNARSGSDLAQTRELVGRHTVDVLGSEQSVALFNKFNYRPRPVIQGYSTFTPALAQLNGDYFSSAQAPEYVLMRVETIDGRLPMMDDAQVMVLLAQRYEYVRTERSYHIWKRNPGPFDPAKVAPRLLRSADVAVNQPLVFGDLSEKQPLWLRVDLQPSLLGKIRSFLYKPPQVRIGLEDTAGNQHDYLMPLPQGRNGFIVNPLIEDLYDYMQFAANRPQKLVRSITVQIVAGDEKYFAATAQCTLSTLPTANSAASYFPKDAEGLDKLFTMFKSYPIAFQSQTGFAGGIIDGKGVAIMHAPSQMIFEVPPGAKTISGQFGFVEATYTNGGNTNGAWFLVYWSDGTKRVDLFARFMNPVNVTADRGLQDFSASLKGISGGRLYLETTPGPYNDYSWDWTGWTGISISK
jgi:hypothetical protein